MASCTWRSAIEQSGYKTYRGRMRMLVTANGLQTVNILPLEQYLRGVVPAESPASWPIEAVKAQAVAARSYAWQRMKPNGNMGCPAKFGQPELRRIPARACPQ